jgi:WD40 repeat protein
MQVNMRTGGVESEANVTDIHEALHFDVMEERDSGYHHSFGIWSLRWGADGREIVAGTGDHSLYVYNMERQKVGALSGILLGFLSWSQCDFCMPSAYFFLEPHVAVDQASNNFARVTVALAT